MRAWEAPNGGHAAIVALRLTIFALFGFDNTDEARFDEATTESGFIQQDECIERIAILGHGPGNRAEIKREKRALREDTLEHVSFALHVEGKLASASFRCVDDDVQSA